MGDWLKKYGESIYGTRPFVDFGEGPTRIAKAGHFLKVMTYTPDDVRYTRKGDTVYAVVLSRPEAGHVTNLKMFADGGLAEAVSVKNITMLGSSDTVKWTIGKNGVSITAPSSIPQDEAVVYKMQCENVEQAVAVSAPKRAKLLADKAAEGKIVTDGHMKVAQAILKGKKIKAKMKRGTHKIENWVDSSETVEWRVNIDRPGVYEFKGQFLSKAGSVVTLKALDQSVDFEVPAIKGKRFKPVNSKGEMTFKEGAVVTFTLKAKDKSNWKPVSVASLQLIWKDEI